MNALVRTLLSLALVALGVWAFLLVSKDGDTRVAEKASLGTEPDTSIRGHLNLNSSKQCAACHPKVYEEWKSSHHWYSWQNPEPRRKELSDNFRNKDCIPCHAPRPLLEVGYGKRPLEREARREDGVNCFTCHKFKNVVAAANPLSASAESAPCNPVTWAPLAEMKLCSPCHDQHKVHQDWMRSRYAVEGPDNKDCNDCHMPVVAGPGTVGGSRLTHRSHAFPGAHDARMLKTAAVVRAAIVEVGADLGTTIKDLTGRSFHPKTKVERRVVLVEVKNHGTGHSFPADERHRAADLYARFVSIKGPAGPEVRMARFRNPYRHEFELTNPFKNKAGRVLSKEISWAGLTVDLAEVRVLPDFNPDRKIFYEESTQLQAGESRLLWFELPDFGKGRLEFRLYYKLQPFMSNEDAVTVSAINLDL